MSRITKEIAKEVAKKLTSKKDKEIVEVNTELAKKATLIVAKRIPTKVVEVFNLHPNFFTHRADFQFSGNGLNYDWVTCSTSLPYNTYSISPDKKEARELLDLIDLKKDLTKQRNELRRDIENLLYNLRTYVKVGNEFPEAAPFLPKTITTSLSINVSDIRAKLKAKQ